MLKLDGLAAFAAVAEAGSISEAARRLGQSKSVLSERLSDLERDLGVQLAQRTTRRLVLTDAGRAFLPRAERVLRELQDGRDELSQSRGETTGTLRLSAPVSFGCLHLSPALNSFLAKRSGVTLSLDLDDRFVDIAAGGYDAVIRHGPVQDSRLVVHRLAPSRRLLVASPAYLERHGEPRSLEELAAHRAIHYALRETDWRFDSPEGVRVVRPAPAIRVNNGMFMRDAAIAGLGIALLAAFIVPDALRSGTLKALDVALEPEGAELYIASSKDRTESEKIRALVRHLREAFGSPPYWEVASARSVAPDRGKS